MQKKIVLFIGIGCLIALALHAATTASPEEQPAEEAPITYPLHEACQASSLNQLNDAIKTLTDDGTIADRIDLQDKDGNIALHFAAKAKQDIAAIVQALIDAGANRKMINHNDALLIDFIVADEPQNDPTGKLLAVSDEERQALVMQARQKEIDTNNAVNETPVVANKVAVVTQDKPDLD